MAVDSQVLWFLGLGAFAFVTVMAIKPFHAYLMSKGCENMVAVYYNRKVAHMVAVRQSVRGRGAQRSG